MSDFCQKRDSQTEKELKDGLEDKAEMQYSSTEAECLGESPELGRNETSCYSFNTVEIEDPFKRRESITRSPPQHPKLGKMNVDRPRSSSCSSFHNYWISGDDNHPAKRKRQESSPKSTQEHKVDVKTFLANIKKLQGVARELSREINNTYKPKKEIKCLASNIDYLATILEASKYDVIPQDQEEKITAEIGIQVNIQKTEIKTTTDAGVQVDNPEVEADRYHLETRIDEIIERSPESGKGFVDLQEILDLRWPETLYKSVSAEEGNPWTVGKEWDLSFILDSKKEPLDRGFTRILREKIPGFAELAEVSLEGGGLDYMERSVKIGSKKGTNATCTTRIYAMPVIRSSPDSSEDWRRIIFHMAEELKKLVSEGGRKSIAFASASDFVDRDCLMKILEFVFRKSDIKIKVLVPKKRLIDHGQKQATDKQQDAIIVKAGGKSYVELLKTVKENVDPEKLGVSVKSIRKTTTGNLLLKVEGGRKEASALTDEIRAKVDGTEVIMKRKERVFHIADIDAVITAADICRDLNKLPECRLENSVGVTSLRPARDGNQIATVVVPVTVGDAFAKRRRVKIGWTKCRIRERVEIPRCFKCLNFGHLIQNCTEASHAVECLKCGELGHRVKDCKNEAKCRFCNGATHRSDSAKCPRFRQMLKERALKGTPNSQ